MGGMRKRLATVREEDQRRHADTSIDEPAGVQYNRTIQIGLLSSALSAIDCSADPYKGSRDAYKVDQQLVDLEERLAVALPKAKSNREENDTGKKSTSVVIIIVLLVLLVIVVLAFVAHRRSSNNTGAIPTASVLSNLAISKRYAEGGASNSSATSNAERTGCSNPMYNISNSSHTNEPPVGLGSRSSWGLSNVGYVGDVDTESNVGYVGYAGNGSNGTTYAIPMANESANAMYSIPLKGDVRSGHGSFTNGSYELSDNYLVVDGQGGSVVGSEYTDVTA
jgi:hypothetical protein